jgi:hypothetical protein
MSKLTDFEQQVLNSIDLRDTGFGIDKDSFLEDLREIMPPTCTKNERKFLDEIKEKFQHGKYNEQTVLCYSDNHNVDLYSLIYQDNFESNLKELVENCND